MRREGMRAAAAFPMRNSCLAPSQKSDATARSSFDSLAEERRFEPSVSRQKGYASFVEHMAAASRFAFSSTFVICRDDWIFGKAKARNSRREPDSLIRAKISLVARFNSL